MSIVVNFGGKRIVEPGVYAQTKSGVTARPNNFPFGNVMIIDTGSGAGWGGGSGVAGELANGLGSVYSFENPNDFKGFVKGGMIWDASEYIFNPLVGAPSPDVLYIARAAQTVGARINLALTNGAVSFIARNEGTVGNGMMNERLAKAYIKIDGATVAVAATLTVTADSIAIATDVTADSTSPAEFKQKVLEAINAGTATHGYTAKIEGLDLVVFAPQNTGASGDALTITTSGTVTTTAAPSFTGGVDGTRIIKGYGAEIKVGENDPAKFMIEITGGSFNGKSETGYLYGRIEEDGAVPNFIARSPELSTIDEIVAWASTNFNFNASFKLADNYTQVNGGTIVAGDLTTEMVMATGGTELYRPEDLDAVLQSVRELENTYFLCDRFGDEAKGAQNMKILNHIINESEFDKFMVIGGGLDETKFSGDTNSSIEIAKFYDSARVIVAHSGNLKEDSITGRTEVLPSFYHAANVVGRLGGLEPQEPLTFKALRITNFIHSLGIKDRERALQAGVLHNRFVPGIGHVVNQGINTLQKNTQQINPDGTSFEISIMSIGAQLNKELVLNMRPLFIGGNRGNVTPADVKSFVEGYLLSKSQQDGESSLIIKFENVTVRLEQGSYSVEYGYVPNGPINKMFVTGFMLDTNL